MAALKQFLALTLALSLNAPSLEAAARASTAAPKSGPIVIVPTQLAAAAPQLALPSQHQLIAPTLMPGVGVPELQNLLVNPQKALPAMAALAQAPEASLRQESARAQAILRTVVDPSFANLTNDPLAEGRLIQKVGAQRAGELKAVAQGLELHAQSDPAFRAKLIEIQNQFRLPKGADAAELAGNLDRLFIGNERLPAAEAAAVAAQPFHSPHLLTSRLFGQLEPFTAPGFQTAGRYAPAVDLLRKTQNSEGAWTVPFRTTSVSYGTQFIYLLQMMGMIEEKQALADGIMKAVWELQDASGGFARFPGGEINDSMSVQVYLAAKIAGEDEDSPRMKKLEAYINEHQSVKNANRVKPYLMMFGLKKTPFLPPGMLRIALFFDTWLPWVRVIVYPLLYLLSSNARFELGEDKIPSRIGVKRVKTKKQRSVFGESRFFKWLEKNANSDGTLFDYTPTTLFAAAAWAAKGGAQLARAKKALATLEEFTVDLGDGRVYVSPGLIDLGESMVMSMALLDMGVSPNDPMIKMVEDLAFSRRHANGAFGASTPNEKFPDSDSTASTLLGLYRIKKARGETLSDADIDNTVKWILALQNKDGGFGTWERDRLPWLSSALKKFVGKKEIVLSESIVEHTARVTLLLGSLRERSPEIARAHAKAVKWLLSKQEASGGWAATWMVGYMFGTSMVLAALMSKPEDMEAAAAIERGIDFMERHQRPDGGFSESPDSFNQKRSVPLAHSSPTQTGLALIPILTAAQQTGRYWNRLRPTSVRAAHYLRGTQGQDGLWHDSTWTGVVFPNHEYGIYPFIQEVAPMHALALHDANVLGKPGDLGLSTDKAP